MTSSSRHEHSWHSSTIKGDDLRVPSGLRPVPIHRVDPALVLVSRLSSLFLVHNGKVKVEVKAAAAASTGRREVSSSQEATRSPG